MERPVGTLDLQLLEAIWLGAAAAGPIVVDVMPSEFTGLLQEV